MHQCGSRKQVLWVDRLQILGNQASWSSGGNLVRLDETPSKLGKAAVRFVRLYMVHASSSSEEMSEESVRPSSGERAKAPARA